MIAAPSKMVFSPLFEVLSIEPPMNSQHISKNHKRSKMQKLPNPYFLFCQERRTQIHAENPKLPSREVTQLLAQEWKNLSNDAKQIFREKYMENVEMASQEELQKDGPNMNLIPKLNGKQTNILLQIPVGNNKFISLPGFVCE